MGDKEHPEVDGLLGYAGGHGVIISTLEDVDRLSCPEKVCVVAQTTQDFDNYSKIVEKIKELCPQAVVFNTICSSTEKRQAEVIAMASEMDAMFIVGGKTAPIPEGWRILLKSSKHLLSILKLPQKWKILISSPIIALEFRQALPHPTGLSIG